MRRVREHVDRAGSARARSRSPRGAPSRPTRASSGCRRRRRSAARRARPSRRSALPARPARGGSTTTRSGAPGLARRAPRRTGPTFPAKKLRVLDPVQLGVLDRARDRLLRDLDAPHRPRPPGQREPDRARAAVEVEDVLRARRAPRTRAPARTAARPSRCSSGGTRSDGSRKRRPRISSSIASSPQSSRVGRLVRSAGRVVDRPVDRAHLGEAAEHVDEVAGLEALARRGHEDDERLARVPALAARRGGGGSPRPSPGCTPRGAPRAPSRGRRRGSRSRARSSAGTRRSR